MSSDVQADGPQNGDQPDLDANDPAAQAPGDEAAAEQAEALDEATGGEQVAVEQTEAGAAPESGEPQAEAQPEPEAQAQTQAEAGPELAKEPAAEQPGQAAEQPAPTPDETHVAAIPPQHGDDPFDEVDGGDDAATTAVPTAEEDAALRDERARRFGRPQESGAESTAGTEAVSEEGEKESSSPGTVPLAAAAGLAAGAVGSSTTGTQTMPATTASEPTTNAAADDDDPFSEFDDGPSSRAAAHWWSILISVVFVPVAWYLIADGGERTSYNLTNGGPFNLAGPLELAGGALCLFFVLLAARWSSVGAILTGTVALLAGAAFLAFNDEAMQLIADNQGVLVQGLKQLGQNIVDHMLRDAQTGRLAIYGVVLIMAGVVSHGARRQGRREERRKAAMGA